MTYRMFMMLLNATAILSVFGLATTFLRTRFATAATALVALSPFVIYEVYFTWPKLLAASYTLAAAVALLQRRPLLAGLVLGLAYLAHPSALFAVPALLLAWLVLRQLGAERLPVTASDAETGCGGPPGLWRWCVDTLVVAVGLGAVYLGWRALNAGHVVDYFNDYLGTAYGKVDAPLSDWIHSRLHLTANSFIPFRQVFADPHDEFTNVVGGQSPFIVRLGAQWRTTVTVGVGVLYLPMFLYGLARFVRRAALLSLALLVLPTVGFIIFWGADVTGILQEGMHSLFLLAILASFVGHTVVSHSSRISRWVRFSSTARVVEVLFVAMVPTIATNALFSAPVFRITDLFGLGLIVFGALGLAILSWRAFAPDRIAAIEAVTPSLT